MPRVSVVIPTFNRPDLIGRAIRSVLAQTYADFEIIVVDDGDKVSVEEAVAGVGDKRIRYIKNSPPKQGGGATRNVGIREAKGEYVAFLDDDDEWLPTKLEKQMRALLSGPSEVGFCATAVRINGEHGESFNTPRGDGITDFSEMSLWRFAGFLTSALVVKRVVFDEVGVFDETLPSHQEAELMIRVCQKYKGIGVIEPLVQMDVSGHEHVGGNLGRRIEGEIKLLAKHSIQYATRPKALAKHYFQIGLWYRDSGRKKIAKVFFLKSFVLSHSPRHIYHWLRVNLGL